LRAIPCCCCCCCWCGCAIAASSLLLLPEPVALGQCCGRNQHTQAHESGVHAPQTPQYRHNACKP
jgi:hypothetical protein